MRIVLRVSSNNEYCNGGCEFALVDLTPELAELALGRIATLREQKSLDPDVDETYYWAYVVQYFSPWVSLASTEEEVEPATLKVADMLDELRIEVNEVLTVPESFRVPSGQFAAMECEQMIVREDCIAFTAIPKHASFHVQTVEIALAMLEAAVTGASTIHV
ncbi:MAG: hypothetical protein ABSD45_10665 [Terriglobia bacterium]|jgi:hypothetical protein